MVDALSRLKGAVKPLFPGVFVAVITGLAALFLSDHYAAPAMLFALLLGIAMAFLYQEPDSACRAGIEFTAGFVLRLGVGLLGLRVALTDLWALGWKTGLLLVVAIGATILFGVLVARAMGLKNFFGVLTGGAVAICGASAAMAISAALPAHERKERDTLLTIIGVTALSTFAMIVYPIIARLLGLDEAQTSLFLGGTIHDVAQVVGAGYSVSEQTGDLATLVKLVRVSFLLPVVLLILLSLRFSRKALGPDSRAPGVPWFLTLFLVLMLVNSLVTIPESLGLAVSHISRFALIVAIAAIGMKSNLPQLTRVGLKPITLMALETAFIAGLILAAIFWF